MTIPGDFFGDGPTGYATPDTFDCRKCGVIMEIDRSTLVFRGRSARTIARAKRGLRIIR